MIPPAALRLLPRRTLRIGVTGLARAGKTMFLTSVAANLLALGAGRPVLPKLREHLRGRIPRITVAPAGASRVPRFDTAAHLACLAAEPPRWPRPTDEPSLLAFDVVVPRLGFAAALPPQSLRIELLDYPGEWLLDLPLLRTGFDDWSAHALRRLEGRAEAAEFLAFQAGLPRGAVADEALAAAGHTLYVAALQRLREAGLALLQPGRFLMPPPGQRPAWFPFFPHRGSGGLHDLLAQRYAAYVQAVQDDLSDPLFGRLDRLVVLVDLLTALSAGEEAFGDAQAALTEAAAALRWRRGLLESAMALTRLEAPPSIVTRVVFAATKADHVGGRQRANLAALLRSTAVPVATSRVSCFALAAVRCTEDEAVELAGHTVSGVVGRRVGDDRAVRFYPGEVPAEAPDPAFWRHRFLRVPEFEPLRPIDGGRGGVREIGLDAVLLALLDDVL